MSIENELKLIPNEEINPKDILHLLESKGYNVQGELKVGRQEDTYYDDNEGTLNKNGCSFRIRRKNTGAVVTCKIPVVSDTGYKQRIEMEVNIPKEYVLDDGTIFIEDAVDILKTQYPDVQIPENLSMVVKVMNNRNKVNVQAPDGSIIELAFDDLQIQDKHGYEYKMKNEMESEVMSRKS